MPGEIISRCGCRCDLCPAYKDNVNKSDNMQQISDGWKKYFDFSINPEDIYCDGCLNDNCRDVRLLEPKCVIRSCVKENGCENCSQCNHFMCGKFKNRLVVYEDYKNKYGKISRNDYKLFIKPYENGKLIQKLRENSGEYPRMLNKEIQPAFDDMTKFIGDECSDIWTKFYSFIHDNYKLFERIIFYSKNYGWALQLKQNKSSTLFTFFPERKAFTALIVYGNKELEAIEENKGKLSADTYKLISNSKSFPEGKWISYRVLKNEDINDLITLMSFKKKPLK